MATLGRISNRRAERRQSSCMNYADTWCCCGLCAYFQSLSFDWKRRRYIWRAKLFYSVVGGLICFGVLLTTTLMTLIDSRTFFWNYRCGGKAVRLISLNFAGMIGVTGLTGLAALLMARLTDTFSNYSVSDMMAVGKCADRVGLLVKWVPWFTAASMSAWTIFNLVNLTWILVEPRDWCSRRWNDIGIQAVTNCRLWYSGKARCRDQQPTLVVPARLMMSAILHAALPPCVWLRCPISATEAQTSSTSSDASSCNDAVFLQKMQFFYFTPKVKDDGQKGPEAVLRCSFESVQICLTYMKHFSSFATSSSDSVDWDSESLRHCMGKKAANEPPEAFQEADADTSDLYKYVCTYVVSWNVATLVIVCFFYYVKLSSNFESMFYQPPDNEKFLYSVVRPLTPWTT